MAAYNGWWAKAILIGAVVGALLLPIGALGSKFGIWSFQTGFLGLAGGTILAALGVVLGIVGLIVAFKRNLPGNRPPIYLGLAISVLILAVMGVQFQTASSVPPIHNISTDVSDPPQFDKVVALRGEGTNPLEFDAATIAPLQAEHYPWVKSLESQASTADAFVQMLAVVEGLGLEIVNSDPANGLIEATATTFWFGFKDDVAVRVRAADGGSVIDVRSVSRVGLSDLGANARRIGEILRAVQ
ncbi:MAG: DUF1499 domain-containing protein [Gammaproteobacteria bacterium]|nr:DUF1499 domain-containing protein [Gammaproteobacteria bacterium]